MTDPVPTWIDGVTPVDAANLNQDSVAIRNLQTAHARPSWAASRTRSFDPATSIYNLKASNTRNLRDNMASASAGLGPCRIAWIGDSVTAGYLDTPGVNDPVTQFASLLTDRGHKVGRIVRCFNAIGTFDASFDPGTAGTGGTMAYSFPWFAFSSGTCTFSGYGDTCEILSATGSGSYSYSIDGGPSVTVNPAGTPEAVVPATVTGLGDGFHTVAITAIGTVYLLGGGFRYANGITLENAAMSGARTGDWLPLATTYSSTWSLLGNGHPTPDAVVIELGLNDFFQTVDLGTFETNLTTLVQRAVAVDADPILIVSADDPTNSTWLGYVDRIYKVADAQDVPVLDLLDRYGPTAERVDEGQDAGDGVHLSPKGQAFKAAAYADVLAPPNARPPVPVPSGPAPIIREDWALPSGSAWPAQWTPAGTLSAAGGVGIATTSNTPYDSAGGFLTGVADGEILTRARWVTADSERYLIIHARWDNTSGTSGYRAVLSAGDLSIQRLITGSVLSLGSHTATFDVGTWYWLRLRFRGSDLRARVWAYGTPEPAAWAVQATDTTYAAAGLAAVTVLNGNDSVGDTAQVADFHLWEL